MSEILLCNQSLSADFLRNCGVSTGHLHGTSCTKPSSISPFTPYALGKDLTQFDKQIISQLSPPKVASELTNFSLSFGSDNTIAIAEMMKNLQEYNVGLIGTSTSVYANRIGGFARAVREYQDALMAYRSSMSSNASTKSLAKEKAFKAFQSLQMRFRQELNAVNAGMRARRGTPLSSATRATNIARGSRSIAKLDVSSQIQANNLVKLTQHAKFLGNGLAVIDFTSRIGNVRTSYKSGDKWERELFVESSSFALSAGIGIAAVNVGTAALGLLVAATPIGWVGLIVGGVAIAGTAAAASVGVIVRLKAMLAPGMTQS